MVLNGSTNGMAFQVSTTGSTLVGFDFIHPFHGYSEDAYILNNIPIHIYKNMHNIRRNPSKTMIERTC